MELFYRGGSKQMPNSHSIVSCIKRPFALRTLIILLVVFLHFFSIWFFHQQKSVCRGYGAEPVLLLRILPVSKTTSLSKLTPPVLPAKSPASSMKILLPDIEISEPILAKPIPQKSNSGGSTIFDPRLRKLMSDDNADGRQMDVSGLRTWRDQSGTQFVEVSEGRCMQSMSAQGGERGVRWSISKKCGKSEGERIMDAVNESLKR